MSSPAPVNCAASLHGTRAGGSDVRHVTAREKDTVAKRKKIPDTLEAQLLVESRNTCNVCWQSKEVEIHHIVPVELGGDNSEANLIVVCRNCHSVAHTKKEMARNLKPKTLLLYKETWLDLLRRYPTFPPALGEKENDLQTIREILKQGHRRALFYPFHQETPWDMFHSLDAFRVFIQKSGYRLIQDEAARGHIAAMYKALLELPASSRHAWREMECLHGYFGRDRLATLDLKRKTVCFHMNQLARVAGYDRDIIAEDEFEKSGLDIDMPRVQRCYGSIQEDAGECQECDFREECLEASLDGAW